MICANTLYFIFSILSSSISSSRLMSLTSQRDNGGDPHHLLLLVSMPPLWHMCRFSNHLNHDFHFTVAIVDTFLKWNYYNSQNSMPVWGGFPEIISWWQRWQRCVTMTKMPKMITWVTKVATREQQRCHLGISTARTPTHSRATANTTPGM